MVERRHGWNMQGSNGDRDTENRLMDTEMGGEWGGGVHGKSNTATYITMWN